MACPLHGQPSGVISTKGEAMESTASPSVAGMQSWFCVVCVQDEAREREKGGCSTFFA
jgi:hypothetical protein